MSKTKELECLDCGNKFNSGKVYKMDENGLFKSFFCPECQSTKYRSIPKVVVERTDLDILFNLKQWLPKGGATRIIIKRLKEKYK